MSFRPFRAVACATALAVSAVPAFAQDGPEAGQPIAPPGLAARLGLMPLLPTNVPGFRSAFPDYDGRGVLVGILDSGVDPTVPGLLKTSTNEPKVVDLRDFSGEGRIALVAAEVRGDSILGAGSAVIGATAWHGRATGGWFIGTIRERVLGAMPASDLNGDGDDADVLPIVVTKVDGEWAVIPDTDGNGALTGEPAVRDYLRARETFFWRAKPGDARLGVAVNFADVAGQAAPALDLYFDTSAHGTHVAGIAAGRDMYGVSGFDGVAPGAWILGLKISDNAQGGITTSGSMVRAVDYAIRFARERRLPLVLNMSFGVGNELEGRARIDALVDSILAVNPDVVFTISAGNDGPGLSTLGFPGSASRAIGVGASMPPVFRPGAEGPGAMQEPVAAFSARGGELAKPDIITPGVAYSTVPGWNVGDEIKGGTSMAAPHAAGLAARLVSGLTQRGLPIDAARIRLALEATARTVPGATFADEGAGRPDLLRAWTWLTGARDVEPLRTAVQGARGGTSAFVRRGSLPAADTVVTFVVRRERAGPTRVLRLESAAAWLAVPASVELAGTEVLVPVTIRSGVLEGSASAAVRVRSANDTAAGPLARLGVTLLATAPIGVERVLEAGVHGTARLAVPVRAGEAVQIRVTAEGDPAGADVHVYEPDGRPWRNGQSQPLTEDEPVAFAIDGRDAEDGLHEVVLRGVDAAQVRAELLVRRSPLRITGLQRSGGVLRVRGDGTAEAVQAAIVGAERRFTVEGRGGLARRTPIAVPAWARRIVVDVEMERAEWSRFTDFGVTLFDTAGRQLGQQPMNYPGVRLEVVPYGDGAQMAALGLFPGLADPADGGNWTVRVSVRFYAESPTVLTGAPGRPAPGTWAFALAPTAPAAPSDAVPLVRVTVPGRGVDWTHELSLPPDAPVRPAPRRRP